MICDIDLADVKRISFPAGERHVEFSTWIKNPQSIRAILKSSNDIMDLLLLTDILKWQGKKPERLVIPYFPYARQDRATTKETAFSLGVMADIINSMEYKEVHIFEPHSYVTQAVVKNCVVHGAELAATMYINAIRNEQSDLVLLAPDSSAVKKIEKLQDFRLSKGYKELPVVVALKKRDPSTGHTLCTGIYGEIPYNANIVLIDDLCDGGATFIDVAKKLKESRCMYGVFTLNLFVAHGIFSKGLDVLTPYFQTIGTTNSYYNPEVKTKDGWWHGVYTTESI